MKIKNSLLRCFRTTLLLVVATLPAAAQETPVAKLVDEFRTVGNCERGLAAADSFMRELSNDPASQGYIVIYRQGGKQNLAIGRKREIENWVKRQHFDTSRITFLDGTAQVEAKTQFWLVPPGAESPRVEPDDPKALAMPEPQRVAPIEPTTPYVFSNEIVDGVAGCGGSEGLDVAGFIEELKQHPSYRGNIVIKRPTRTEFLRMEKQLLSEVSAAGIARARIKTFFVKNNFKNVELWILPRQPAQEHLLIGTWRQIKAVPCRGKAYSMDQIAGIEELIFNADGSFSVTGRPFETYKDYWGKYAYDAKTAALKFTVEGGNYIPANLDLSGKGYLKGDQLILDQMSLGTGNGSPLCGMTFTRLTK